MQNNMQIYKDMDRDRLIEILNRIGGVKIGLIGDICLDVYWRADMRKSELSRETPHYPLPVIEERMSPGGGANAAANMAALEPKRVEVFGAVGSDWRGRELTRLLKELGLGLSGIVCDVSCVTNAYIKPLRKGFSDVIYEDPRLDFTSYDSISSYVEDKLIAALDSAAADLDILCVSDQMPFGVITKRVREHICGLARGGLRVVADSRCNIAEFAGCTIKPNELEGANAVGLDPAGLYNIEDFARTAKILVEKIHGDVFMTLGDRGSLFVGERQAWHIPGHSISGAIDICGAGDSSLSGFGLSLAAGAKPWEAARIAGLCSEVTIRQIGVTGTASREQILERHSELTARA